jgi:hopene-associated glycosyltransferase HpnB
MTTVATLALAVWLYLLLAHGRFWHSGPELAPAKPMTAPAVAVVVPARDEAAVIGATLPSLQRQDYAGAVRIIMVDDASTDGTGSIARHIAETSSQQLDVLDGKPRPPGWSGKLWAIAQGIAETGPAEFILLTDADITHDPRHLATLVAQAERDDLDLVSEMVTLACTTQAERTLVPAFVYFFQLLYPFAWVNDPMRATAAAAGGTVLIRRRALQRIGGIEALRGA